MDLKKARIAVYICLGAVCLSCLLFLMIKKPWCCILALVFLTVEMIFYVVFIRCPHCGRFLDRAGMRFDATHCPFCGKELDQR